MKRYIAFNEYGYDTLYEEDDNGRWVLFEDANKRIRELEAERTRAMNEYPICECSVFWPNEGHHPECPVKRRIRELEAEVAWLQKQNEALELRVVTLIGWTVEKDERIAKLEAEVAMFKQEAKRQIEAAEAKVAAALEICNSFMVRPTTRLEWLFGSQIHAALSDKEPEHE
jgi:hypothetical protein